MSFVKLTFKKHNAALSKKTKASRSRRTFSLDQRVSIHNSMVEQTDGFAGTPNRKAFFEACVKEINESMEGVEGWQNMDGTTVANFHQNGMNNMLKELDGPLKFDKGTDLTPDLIARIERALSEPLPNQDPEDQDKMQECWLLTFKVELFLRRLKEGKGKSSKDKKKVASDGKERQAAAYAAAVTDQADAKVDLDALVVEDEETDRKKEKAAKKRASRSSLDAESLSSLTEGRVETARIAAESTERIAKMQLEAEERREKNQRDLMLTLLGRQEEETKRREEREEKESARREAYQMSLIQMLLQNKDKKE